MRAQLPSGTVTFLFTDVQGSTRLWEQQATAMTAALTRHDEILHRTIATHRGHVIKSTGDGILAVFSDARDAVGAVVEAQRALGAEDWGAAPLRVRMGLHSGAAETRDGDYFGTAVNRAARLTAVAHGGQVLLSLATEQLVREGLPSEIELVDLGEYQLRDLARAERIFQVRADGLERQFPRLASVGAEPTNLPVQLTSFVGRRDELKELAELLDEARLVSLVGSGGCGKTRLAVEVAGEALERFRDGAWFVDLAGVSDPELVVQTVATALGEQEEAGRSYRDTVLSYLRGREILVVLDNCEQLIQPCAELADALLRACPSLRMITTTREPLGVAGEVTWRVPSLSVPPPEASITAEHISEYGALRLFFDRVERARPGFRRSDETAAIVAEICRGLDGIPLAIELAAARVRLLSLEDVLAGLTDQLRLLGRGPRTAAARHRTIAASIEWSHDLLSEEEQIMLRRISVFSGGFDLDGAEYVGCGSEIDPADALDVLAGLVDRSLVSVNDEHDSARYGVLETIRQFAADRLVRANEAPSIRTRHLEHFVAFAERAAPLLEGRAESEWMDRLEIEHNNLRAALDWSLTEDVESGLRLAAALHYFWYVRGHYSAGSRWFERLLEADATVAPRVRADALYGDSYLTGWGLGRFNAIIPRLRECLDLARGAGDPRVAGRALWALGTMLTSQEPVVAADALEEAVELARQADDTWCLSSSLSFLGTSRFNSGRADSAFSCFEEALEVGRRGEHLAVLTATLGSSGTAAVALGDYPLAEAQLTECLVLARELGHRLWIAGALGMLASLASRRGHYEEARDLAEEAMEAARESSNALVLMGASSALGSCAFAAGEARIAAQHFEAAIQASREMRAPPYTAVFLANLGEVRLVLGDQIGAQSAVDSGRALAHIGRPLTQAQILNVQGRLAYAQGDLDAAHSVLIEALALFEQVGDPQGQADTLEDLAAIAVDRGDYKRAARLLGVGRAMRDRIGYVRFVHRRDQYDAMWSRASSSLGAASFDEAVNQSAGTEIRLLVSTDEPPPA